jgi:hypothetical protein
VASVVVAVTKLGGDVARPWNAVALLTIGGLFLVSVAARAVRAISSEPEPVDQDGARSLLDAYAVHRAAKASGYYWLTVAAVAWLSVGAVVAATTTTAAPIVGIALETTASGIAIAGAAFGVHMASARLRIRATLEELRVDLAST